MEKGLSSLQKRADRFNSLKAKTQSLHATYAPLQQPSRQPFSSRFPRKIMMNQPFAGKTPDLFRLSPARPPSLFFLQKPARNFPYACLHFSKIMPPLSGALFRFLFPCSGPFIPQDETIPPVDCRRPLRPLPGLRRPSPPAVKNGPDSSLHSPRTSCKSPILPSSYAHGHSRILRLCQQAGRR